ncbi:MAG: hypothetical protein ABSG88_19205 [Bradyrhizobium sp.]
MARDPAKASAEYLAEFRDDIAGWLGLEIIQAAVDHGVTMRPPSPFRRYFAFVDRMGASACGMQTPCARRPAISSPTLSRA